MKARVMRNVLFASPLVLFLSTPVFAENLYRWTDATGRVHFSDRAPPPDVATTVDELQRPAYANSGVPAGHYGVTQQWQRLQAERLARQREQRERQRQARELALREREVEAAERAAEQAVDRASSGSSVWIVPRRHIRRYRPGRPPHHVPNTGLWKHDHPAYRLPSRPGRRHDPHLSGMRLHF